MFVSVQNFEFVPLGSYHSSRSPGYMWKYSRRYTNGFIDASATKIQPWKIEEYGIFIIFEATRSSTPPPSSKERKRVVSNNEKWKEV